MAAIPQGPCGETLKPPGRVGDKGSGFRRGRHLGPRGEGPGGGHCGGSRDGGKPRAAGGAWGPGRPPPAARAGSSVPAPVPPSPLDDLRPAKPPPRWAHAARGRPDPARPARPSWSTSSFPPQLRGRAPPTRPLCSLSGTFPPHPQRGCAPGLGASPSRSGAALGGPGGGPRTGGPRTATSGSEQHRRPPGPALESRALVPRTKGPPPAERPRSPERRGAGDRQLAAPRRSAHRPETLAPRRVFKGFVLWVRRLATRPVARTAESAPARRAPLLPGVRGPDCPPLLPGRQCHFPF